MRKHRKYIVLFLVLVLLLGGVIWVRSKIRGGVSAYLEARYPELRFEIESTDIRLIPLGGDTRVLDTDSGVSFDVALRYETETVQAAPKKKADPEARQILGDLQNDAMSFKLSDPIYSDNYRASLSKVITSEELSPVLSDPNFAALIDDWQVSITGEDPQQAPVETTAAHLTVRWNSAVIDEATFVEEAFKFQQALEQLQVPDLVGVTFQSMALPLDPEAFQAIGAEPSTWLQIYTKAPEPTTVPLETTSIDPQEMTPEDWEALVEIEETSIETIGVSSGYSADWYYYTLTLNQSFKPFTQDDLQNGTRIVELTERDKRFFVRSFE